MQKDLKCKGKMGRKKRKIHRSEELGPETHVSVHMFIAADINFSLSKIFCDRKISLVLPE